MKRDVPGEEQLKERFIEERYQVEPANVMSDQELSKFDDMSYTEFFALPINTRRRFYAKVNYNRMERMSISSLEGIDIGGMSVKEALEKSRKGEDPYK